MDESTFETFEEELCPSEKQEPLVKPIQQPYRPDPQLSKKMREEPPRAKQKERSSKGGTVSLHRTISLQSLTRIEAPWEWITLNRCLVLAIALVLFGSSFQKLREMMEGLGQKVETQSPEIQSIDLRHSLELDSQLEQIESFLWDNWFWNLILDDGDNEDEDSEEEDEEEEEEISRWVAEQRSEQGRLGVFKYMKPTKHFPTERKEARGQEKMSRRKIEELGEIMKEHGMRRKIKRKRSEEDEDLREDEVSPKRKKQSMESEKLQKLKKQKPEVKKLPIRGHRHHL